MRILKKMASIVAVISILLAVSVTNSFAYYSYENFYFDLNVSDKTATLVQYYGTEENATVNIPVNVKGYTVTSIGDGAFRNKTNVKYINMTSAIKSIGNGAFSGCSSLARINLPVNINSVGDCICQDCTSLETAYFNCDVKSLPNGTFYGCTNLKNVTLIAGLKIIESNAFFGCKSLSKMPELSYVSQIMSFAFYDTMLTDVVLNSNVEFIGEYAFANSQFLSNVKIHNKNAEIQYKAFDACSNNLTISSFVDSTAQEYCQDNQVEFNTLILYGDVNNDSLVDIKDVTYLQKCLTMFQDFTLDRDAQMRTRADVNGDGDVDIQDGTLIQKYINHSFAKFPVEQQ